MQLGDSSAKDEVTVVVVGPEGTMLATGNHGGRIKLWSVAGTDGTEMVTLSGHRAAVTAMRFIEGGALLVSGSQDTDVIVWDVVAEAGVVRLHGHTGPVTDLAHLASENLLFSASKDTLVKVWDMVTQHCVQTIVGHRTEVYGARFGATLLGWREGGMASPVCVGGGGCVGV
jgi:U3 small nucleolar RNA-associated protein 12